MKSNTPWLDKVAEQNVRDAEAVERLVEALPRISDTELEIEIKALTAYHKARSISQNHTLSALIELRGLRRATWPSKT